MSDKKGNRYPCLNNGTCKEQGECECTDDHGGVNCAYTNLCRYTPCKNNAQCLQPDVSSKYDYVPKNNSYTCECVGYWDGPTCAQPLTHLAPGSIAAIVVSIIAAVLFCVLCYFGARYVRRSRKLKGKYNPAKEELSAGPPGAQSIPLSTLAKKNERMV